MEKKKRALALGGGGPAVGLSIGALNALKEAGITFDVWTCACIGAWLGVVYNQAEPGKQINTCEQFFGKIFRPDDEYSRFPIAGVFAPDFQAMVRDSIEFVMNPRSYVNLVVPDSIARAANELMRFVQDPSQWNFADFNSTYLNDVLAVNPASRFITSLMYLTPFKGMSRTYYPASALLESIDFKKLYQEGKPHIYYNSYNATTKKMELFTNNKTFKDRYGPITAETLCACSALPFVEMPVTMNGDTYIEGALIDTVSFERLLYNHPDLDEVWVSRILDRKQIRPANNLYEALNNLMQMFAANTSEDDVKLFRYKLDKENERRSETTQNEIKLYEIHVEHHINYDWSWSNLNACITRGQNAAQATINNYPNPTPSPPIEEFTYESQIPWPAWA